MGSIRKPELLQKPVKLTATTLRLPLGSTLNIGAAQYNLISNLDLNTAVTGVGGCDVAVAAGSLYYVYAVVSSGTVYLIASLNSSLPSGFTQARAVGGFTTNASSQIDQVANQAGDLSIAGSLSSLGALSTPDTRNMIINGGFDFWQRNTTASNPGASGIIAYSTADRFWTQWDISAGTMALSRQTLTQAEKTTIGGGSKYFFRWGQSAGHALNNYRILATSIEGVSQFHSKPTTFSFWAKASSNISVTPQIIVSSGSGGTGSYGWASIGTANITTTWQKFSFTLPVIDMSTWAVPNEHTSYLAVTLWLPHALSTFTLDTTCWMLNEGYTAAPFRRAGGTIGAELQLCQRYYEKSYDVDVAPGTASQYGGLQWQKHHSTSMPQDWRMMNPRFSVLKRAAPSCFTYSFAGTPGQASDLNSEADLGTNSAQVGNGLTSYFWLRNFSGGAITLGALQTYTYHWTADAEL